MRGEGETSPLDADSPAPAILAAEDDWTTGPAGRSDERSALGTIVSASLPNATGGGRAPRASRCMPLGGEGPGSGGWTE